MLNLGVLLLPQHLTKPHESYEKDPFACPCGIDYFDYLL